MTSTLIRISILMFVSPMCICYRGNDTASNLACRPGQSCGRHGYSYTWCYTDAKNFWDYCCDGPCKYDSYDGLRCKSGTYDVFCGNPGPITALGNECKSWHTCGHHLYEYFWCYTPTSWEYCCHPNETCRWYSWYQYYVCSASAYRNSGAYLTRCNSLS
ncbi:hypothetical protein CHS0354_010634 [Potamilus streckersoni]|uniref:Uncharacterized protein n=1 Tax=Potamilus streckersoni TaxID=2493646 RepID=A0AAE0SFR3_9BIVA|nr:hypothetical protein CHS0354_010634 [Potamilus streckersoni]